MVEEASDHKLHVAVAHKFGDHERLPIMPTQVEHEDNMRMGAQAALREINGR